MSSSSSSSYIRDPVRSGSDPSSCNPPLAVGSFSSRLAVRRHNHRHHKTCYNANCWPTTAGAGAADAVPRRDRRDRQSSDLSARRMEQDTRFVSSPSRPCTSATFSLSPRVRASVSDFLPRFRFRSTASVPFLIAFYCRFQVFRAVFNVPLWAEIDSANQKPLDDRCFFVVLKSTHRPTYPRNSR